MTLHELATNAAKYAALTHPDGKLDVKWVVREDGAGRRLTMTWTESGFCGPAAVMVKESFGTRLIGNANPYDLQGQSDYKLSPNGVTCTLSAFLMGQSHGCI